MNTVVFIPDWREANPYQARLGQTLESFGFRVQFDNRIKREHLRNARIDILHLHWISQMVGGRNRVLAMVRTVLTIAKLVACKLSRVKIVWTVHNLRGHESKYPGLETILGMAVSRIADAMIVHTNYAREAVCGTFRLGNKAKCMVIPHSGYVGDYDNTVNRDEARIRLGVKRDDFVYLYFGMVRRYKGILQLVDAFKEYRDPNVVLVIAGKAIDGEIKKALEEKASRLRNIRLYLDFIPNQDVQFFMNAADVVVLPFENILTSGSLMLAISFGKPVVSRCTGAVTDVVGEDGGIFFDGDKDGLLKALIDARNAPTEAMGEKNHRIANMHTWKTMAVATAKLYNQILAS